MALPTNPTHGDLAFFNGAEFFYDSEFNRWLIRRAHARIDLDSEVEVLRSFFYSGAQSAGFPVGSVVAFANGKMPQGFILANGSTFNTTTYPELFDYLGTNVLPDYTDRDFGYKTFDWGQSFDSDSDLTVNIIFGIAAYNGAGMTTDSDVLYNAVQRHTTRFDSDILVLQNRVTELEGELAQAVSDRIFTDNLLAARLDGHDSDIALRGRFYVQATPPSGGPNSGWVNTTNMKLNIWDETSNTWVEVVTT